jgi:K+ transporter
MNQNPASSQPETAATPAPAPTTQPSALGPAVAQETQPDKRMIITLIAIAVVVVLVLVGSILFLAADPARTANIRDIFIIALSLVSLAIGVLLVVLVWQLQSLIVLLRNEIRPLLINANQTVNTVRGTTVFMSDSVARPAIRVVSFFSGLRSAASAAGQRGRAAGRAASQRAQQRMHPAGDNGQAGAQTGGQPRDP